MKKSTKIIIPVVALGVLSLAGIYGISKTNADENDGRGTIIQKVAEKFNLNEEEVETVFNEHRKERGQEMLEKFNERLDQAVADGKITEAQKQAILDKKKELWQNREEIRDGLKDLSPEERQEKMKEHREEMKKWMGENGLEFGDLGLFGDGHRGHRGGHFGPKF